MADFSFPNNNFVFLNLGVQVKGLIKLAAGSYKTRLQNGEIDTIEYTELLLSAASSIEVQKTKNIIQTPLNGGRGVFTELINEGYYRIIIRGVLVANSYEELNIEIAKIASICQVSKELPIINDYLQTLGVEYISVQEVNFPELRTAEFVRNFEIIATEDRPLQLIKK